MRALLSSTALYALAIVAAKGVSFLMLPVVTGHLSPAEYGALELLISIADVAGLVLAMGLADALFRFGREAGMGATLLGFSLALGVAMLGLGQVTVLAAAPALPPVLDPLHLHILAATLALTAAIQVPLAWLRFRGRPGAFAAVSVAKAAGQAGLVVLFLSQGYGVTGILLGGLIADGLSAALLVGLQIRDVGLAVDPARIRRVLPYGLPLVVSGLFGFVLGSFDRWILAATVTPEALALYGLAAKFGLIAALAMQPFEMWWYPRRLGLLDSEEGRRSSARYVALGLTWATLCASGVALASPPVIAWLTPAAYHGAAAWVPWLAAIAFLHAATNLLNVGCYAGRSTHLPMAINGAAAGVALTGYLLLIPSFGVEGTIAATLLAQGVRLCAFFAFSQRSHPIPHRILRLAIVPVTAVVAVCLSISMNSLVFSCLALAGTLGMAVAVGLVTPPTRPQPSLQGDLA